MAQEDAEITENIYLGIITVMGVIVLALGIYISTMLYSKGVLEGRLIEIDAKVKLLKKNYYPEALPEVP